MKLKLKHGLLFTAASLSLVACKTGEKQDVTNEQNTEVLAESTEKNPGLDLHYIDNSVSPQHDFYNFVNGNWLKETEIPGDRTSWGGFQILRKNTDNDVLAILDAAEKSDKYAGNTDQAKAIFLFQSQLDTVTRNKAGIKPLQPALDKIASIESLADLQTVKAKNTAVISDPFFGLTAFSNPTNSDINSAYIAPGGLGLPDRDYYTDTDEAAKKIRQQYKEHITRMLQFLGDSKAEAAKQANTILALETRLATPRLDKVASRDFRNFNNPRSINQVSKMVPAINWEKWIEDLGVEKELDTVLVMQPKYMDELQKIFAEDKLEDLKTLMRWATLNSSASELSTEIEKANWDFYSKTLNGAKKQRPIRERALKTVNNSIGEALGKLYVDQKFPPEAKAKAEKMIANIISAFEDRINQVEWMSPDTKTKAIEKLDKFTVKIGYPDKWEDYSELEVNANNNYYQNRVAIANWSYQDNLSEINEPVDKTEWGMSPQTVNAYFNPFNNEIVFPAAILQPPFYNYKADEAVNYGGIGAVIGHEISHAFDDSGARFDGDGNLNNWWTEEDLKQFTLRGKQLAKQYSDIEVLEDVYINGDFTLGENIGDLGGVLAAYDGLQKYYEANGRPGKIDGYTPEQRFFMSWATIWRTKMRDEALKSKIKTDPHSPGMYRAYVPLQNVDAFYEAFEIKKGDDMYIEPEKRVSIW